jgi:hypothetical protein
MHFIKQLFLSVDLDLRKQTPEAPFTKKGFGKKIMPC